MTPPAFAAVPTGIPTPDNIVQLSLKQRRKEITLEEFQTRLAVLVADINECANIAIDVETLAMDIDAMDAAIDTYTGPRQ